MFLAKFTPIVLSIMLSTANIQSTQAISDRVNGVIYVGDSRFKGMDTYINKGAGFVVSENAMGYEWLSSTAMEEIEKIKKDNPSITQWTIISNLGINDLENVDKYIEFYKSITANGDKLVFMSVNPVDGKWKNLIKTVDTFNQQMKRAGFEYLDTFSYLMEDGFTTTDGIHYTDDIHVKIWNQMNDYLLKR